MSLDCRPAKYLARDEHFDGLHASILMGQTNMVSGVISLAVGELGESRAVGETSLFHEFEHVALAALHGGDGDANHSAPDLFGGSVWTARDFQHIHGLKLAFHGCSSAEHRPFDAECYSNLP
jgi:hypothetical protein